MNSRRYKAVLDVYALLATYPGQAEALIVLTQYTALCYLQKKARKAEVIVLLRLARDLGYIDEQLFAAHTTYFV